MKRMIHTLTVLATVLVMSSHVLADEHAFKGIFTTETIPEAVGKIENMGSFLISTRSNSFAVDLDEFGKKATQWKMACIEAASSEFVAIAKQLGHNAVLKFDAKVTHSFSAHGDGMLINGTHGFVTLSFMATAVPATIK